MTKPLRSRLLFGAAFLALLQLTIPPLAAQGPSSAQIQAAKGLVWLIPTASLPTTCAPGRRVYDTTADTSLVCANDGVTWNAIGGGTPTFPLTAPAADNCAAVPYSFTGDTNTGLCSSAADTVVLRAGGVSGFSVNGSGQGTLAGTQLTLGSVGAGRSYWNSSTGYALGSALAMCWSSDTDAAAASCDTFVKRDAANTLALRNGTNAQAFRVYNTYTDASNNEYFYTLWSSNIAYLGTAKTGSGTARGLSISAAGTFLNLGVNDSTQWQINSSGHLLAAADNAYDIGASGATRPRNVYTANNLTVGNIATVQTYLEVQNALGYLGVKNGGVLKWPSDGLARLGNYADTHYIRIKSSGAPSVAGSCGTTPSVVGEDSAMLITTGTGSPTSCAVTFQSTWTTAPVCVANAQTTTTPLNVATTATTVTVSAAALTAGEIIQVHCLGY